MSRKLYQMSSIHVIEVFNECDMKDQGAASAIGGRTCFNTSAEIVR